jgi:hypothetical protein
MLKKILIITGIIVVGLIVFFNWFKKDTKKHSPSAVAQIKDGDLAITINYCRPYAKGRVIFGDEQAEALQPYGKYWRLGANEATTFENNQSIMFNDKELAPGKYSMYAYPSATLWTICINKEWDRWGAQEANAEQDIFRTEVPCSNEAPFEEQFSIKFEPKDTANTFQLVFHWDKTEIKVPIKRK